jgi:hypothetical protein
MNKHTPQHVREAYEHYIRAYNAHDSRAYWGCFHWPHTAINGSSLVVHDRPSVPFDEVKRHQGCVYVQIVTLQVVAYSEHTAHLVVRLACLNAQTKMIAERDMVYIYKKILDEWKIYVVSQADDAHIDTTPVQASSV